MGTAVRATPACVVSKSAPPQVEEAGRSAAIPFADDEAHRIATEFVQSLVQKELDPEAKS